MRYKLRTQWFMHRLPKGCWGLESALEWLLSFEKIAGKGKFGIPASGFAVTFMGITFSRISTVPAK